MQKSVTYYWNSLISLFWILSSLNLAILCLSHKPIPLLFSHILLPLILTYGHLWMIALARRLMKCHICLDISVNRSKLTNVNRYPVLFAISGTDNTKIPLKSYLWKKVCIVRAYLTLTKNFVYSSLICKFSCFFWQRIIYSKYLDRK